MRNAKKEHFIEKYLRSNVSIMDMIENRHLLKKEITTEEFIKACEESKRLQEEIKVLQAEIDPIMQQIINLEKGE